MHNVCISSWHTANDYCIPALAGMDNPADWIEQRPLISAWTLHSPPDSIEQSAQEAVSTVHTPMIDLTLATPQHQPSEHSLHAATYPPPGQPTRIQSQLEHKSESNRESKNQRNQPNIKFLDISVSERKAPESKGPKIKAPGEKEASKKDSGKKIPESKRRPRCGQCIGCLQKDDCGECVACRK